VGTGCRVHVLHISVHTGGLGLHNIQGGRYSPAEEAPRAGSNHGHYDLIFQEKKEEEGSTRVEQVLLHCSRYAAQSATLLYKSFFSTHSMASSSRIISNEIIKTK